jgi:hypothetical protein
MKRLSKDQLATRNELVKRLRDAAGAIETAIDTTNGVIDEYNAILADVESFRDEVVGEMETYYDERSEKWQETDAGSSYQDWKSQFEALDVDQLEQLELDDLKLADDLEEFPDEPEA